MGTDSAKAFRDERGNDRGILAGVPVFIFCSSDNKIDERDEKQRTEDGIVNERE
jgi:hypothetical protein